MYERYADDIYRYLYVHVRDAALAEDLMADTFMRAWKSLDSFDFAQARPWLYKIARNLLTDHWRKKKPEHLDEDDEPVSDADSVEEQVDKQLDKERVQAAMAELPRTMRDVVALRFMLGYSARDTAAALHMSEENVRVVQYRALKKMKGYLS